MILQQFPTSEVTKKILQKYYSNIGEEYPGDYENPMYQPFFLKKNKGMLFDQIRDSSLLFDKIDIAKVIPFSVDISPYENQSGQLPAASADNNTAFEKYNTPLELISNSIGDTSPYTTTESAIKKFITFVKVVGLADLGLDCVYLTEDDEDLVITIAENHPIYMGSLRVKTW